MHNKDFLSNKHCYPIQYPQNVKFEKEVLALLQLIYLVRQKILQLSLLRILFWLVLLILLSGLKSWKWIGNYWVVFDCIFLVIFPAKNHICNTLGIIGHYDPQSVTNMILCREDYEKYTVENDPIITDPLPGFEPTQQNQQDQPEQNPQQ